MQPDARFSRATTISTLDDGRFGVDIHPGWTIAGRPNGGYLLALLGRAATAVVDHEHPVAATAHFLRPPQTEPAELHTHVLRVGRSASQVRVELVQHGAACISATFTLAAIDPAAEERWSSVAVPDIAAQAECWRIPPLTPRRDPVAMMATVDIRLDPDVIGYTRKQPSGRGELRGWIGLPDDEDFDPFSLLFAVDALPPASLEVELSGWVPTLELTAYVFAHPAPGPVRVRQQAQVIADGRMDEICHVWDSAGRLVARGSQLAGVRFL
jgi:acyl-CoA thioesterase